MSSPRRGGLRPAPGLEVEKAWRCRCKLLAAGSRRAAWRFFHAERMPESLWDYAMEGRYFNADPPLKPMRGPEFEKWLLGWEREQEAAATWEKMRGWPKEEGEDPDFLEAVAGSKKDADDKARAEAAQTITAVEELKAREAAEEKVPVIALDD